MRSANVLLVEDDPAYHVLVDAILNPEGHEVSVASTVDKATKYIERAIAGTVMLDAVILDFRLNDGDATRDDETGNVVLALMRSQLPEIPVIGFSGRTMSTHGIDNLYADPTKDGLWDLPDIIQSLPEQT
jgi:DNA-binding response OmpR family regulator